MAGKGSRRRPTDRDKWDKGWERVYGGDKKDRNKSSEKKNVNSSK